MQSPDVDAASADASAAATVEALHCPECGYSLRGLSADRCPECGYSLADARSGESRIPWHHRRAIGRWSAFRRTVWMVSFRHRRFCDEMARGVSYADSQRFRWIVVIWAYAWIAATTAAFAVVALMDDRLDLIHGAFVRFWPFLYPQLFCLPWIALATGVPSYFFVARSVPTELQNRAVALSYYGCAVLGWVPLAAVSAGLGYALRTSYELLGDGLIGLGAFAGAGLAALWWLDLVHIALRVMPHLPRRVVMLALCVPLLWLAAAFVCFLVLPAIVIYVSLAVYSLAGWI